MFLFKFDSLEDRRTVTAKGIEYIVAKESLSELLNLIMEKGNEEEQERARNVDSHIACYVPDNVFKTASDDALAHYIDEHIYDGELFGLSRDYIAGKVLAELSNVTDRHLAAQITDCIIDDVVEDVKEASGYSECDDSDIGIAIGRALLKALNKEKTKVPRKTIRFA
jgi:hypothetical protein